MVHWVYVLESSDSGSVYVGETTRLYRRWNEHRRGRGGVTTSGDDYDTLIGLYHVGHNWSFMTYRDEMLNGTYNFRCAKYWDEEREKGEACAVENHITEQYLNAKDHTAWWEVHGGKYCKRNCVYDLTHVAVDRPLCNCGYPCEIKLKNDQTKLYFTCPVPNWTTFEGVVVPKACSFWEEFKPFRELNEKTKKEYAENKRVDYISQKRAENLALFIQMTDE